MTNRHTHVVQYIASCESFLLNFPILLRISIQWHSETLDVLVLPSILALSSARFIRHGALPLENVEL